MQDRFKFRVWLPFEKRMITTDNGSFFALNQHGSLLKINDKNEAFFARIGHTFSKENIMQCTGLKDKNGKLIHEGDILGGIYENLYINWCNKCKQFQLKAQDYGCMACEGDIHWAEVVEDNNKLEVIGNIYQDEELLNGNNP